ncbi:site-specific integrase [Parabacteroides distasonis]|uniref:site-specific integrase n=3 Tax=Parabacteroides distasonis TaxID=823 RepID=UPI00189D205F|nr:site-specific integrase [Parabacteroides distasonis]MDB9152134.1 site-specific integrase [Parabacteroides distasonis]MDB9156689.1 site-specific integrase [Parabacteroides distasonis]MDB9165814.1 site-specific integrase [Parabacteroides distasonis]MDB9170222.1 site-specific integrase [Parabacteroides distasonis]
MTSIKLKWRASRVEGKPGSFFVQLIHKRKVGRIPLCCNIYASEWDPVGEEILFPANRKDDRAVYLCSVKEEVDRVLNVFHTVIGEMGDEDGYTVSDLVARFYERSRLSYLSAFMEHIIADLEKRGLFVTARHYRTAMRTFNAFMEGKDIQLVELTSVFLTRFELYLWERSRRKNTVSFYLRIFRAVWRKAIAQGLLEPRVNPFTHVYTGVATTGKRAVSESVILELKRADLDLTPGRRLACDLFLFCYYARGMAFVDLAYLTSDNIQGEVLVYRRHKTGQELRVKLLPEMWRLIRTYKRLSHGKYLFPVLKSENPSQREYDSALRLQNKRLNVIGKKIGVERLSTYVARHTWASVAKQKGVPEEVISDCMGHTSLRTTRIYIALLDTSRIDYANRVVVHGKKVNKSLFKYGAVP